MIINEFGETGDGKLFSRVNKVLRKGYLTVSGTIFCIVAILHLGRVLFGTQVYIDNWVAPMWISWGGFLGGSVLCTWAFKLIRK